VRHRHDGNVTYFATLSGKTTASNRSGAFAMAIRSQQEPLSFKPEQKNKKQKNEKMNENKNVNEKRQRRKGKEYQ